MILFDGKILPDKEWKSVQKALPDYCIRTIAGGEITVTEVIEACAVLSDRIREGVYDGILCAVLKQGRVNRRQIEETVRLFCRENLRRKYQTEIGDLEECQSGGNPSVERIYVPLGILFHIAAGNAEGLPFYSVLEGLMVGNINILKLPSGDDGLSVFLLKELVKIHPPLARYIIAFQISSADPGQIQSLGRMADAIVVWGKDEAVRAVRKMADPCTQIISWGHKVSFAYAAPDISPEELRKLAGHICITNQLLCSSCQGIFVDTEDMDVVREFGIRFLGLLEEERKKYPPLPLEIRGKTGLELYNEELETLGTGRKILRGKGVSVTLADDRILEPSHMFCNVWVKPLPEREILKVLKPYRGYLQTAGLLCHEKDYASLKRQLIRAGVVRITGSGGMSSMTAGGTHDGEYPLRRYCKVVEIQRDC